MSEGESWNKEEREEVDEAAALRRSWGSGEVERREGRVALRDDAEVIV